MDVKTDSEPMMEKASSISLPFSEAAPVRLIYGLYITLLPALAFWSINFFKPEWQSGKSSDYLVLFLFPEASLIFLLLLAYSIVCYLLLLIAPVHYVRFFAIRFGIYTGTLLALQYSILSVPVLSNTGLGYTFLLVWILPLVFPFIYHRAADRWTTSAVNNILFVLAAASVAIGILTGFGWAFGLMAFVTSAPFWSFLMAVRASIWLLKNHETKFNLSRGLSVAPWLAAYAVAWRYDILKMYELYVALPKQPPPDCYIATAAARGHPQVVQAWSVLGANGISLRVNAQLQRLKCAELALMAVHPSLHAFLRHLYDVIGKHLASKIQNPFLADLAYLLLKPCEWSAGFLLKRIVPEIDSITRKMYT
jgi:hypothetical protein